MVFNFSIYKTARWGEYPPGSLPDEMERMFRLREDPFKSHKPGDGKGNKMSTPASDGMPGEPSDIGAAWGGGKGRPGYPKGISVGDDPGDNSEQQIQTDKDPDHPFTGRQRGEGETWYGRGQDTNVGQALHDDTNIAGEVGDSAVGIRPTVGREINPEGDRDRKSPYYTMNGPSDKPLVNRTVKNDPKNPFNKSLMRIEPMEEVRKRGNF